MAEKKAKSRDVSFSLVLTVSVIFAVVVYMVCVGLGYFEPWVAGDEERSALAIFVGLLATAFAFLYSEFSTNVRYYIEKGWMSEKGSETIFEMRDQNVYEGEEGKLKLATEYTVVLGELYGLLAVPLFSYVGSVVVSIIGIAFSEKVVAYVGLALLAWSFVACGWLLIVIHRSVRKATMEYAERVYKLYSKELAEKKSE